MKDKIIYLLDAYTSTGLRVGCRGDEIYNSDTGEILIPSDEIKSKAKALEAEYDAKQYQRDRSASYPSVQDQLDMLYHQGIDGWKAKIKSIKDKFPKP